MKFAEQSDCCRSGCWLHISITQPLFDASEKSLFESAF